MQEDPEALRKIMQQMTVTNPDAATAAQAQRRVAGYRSWVSVFVRRKVTAENCGVSSFSTAPATPSVRDVFKRCRQPVPDASSRVLSSPTAISSGQ